MRQKPNRAYNEKTLKRKKEQRFVVVFLCVCKMSQTVIMNHSLKKVIYHCFLTSINLRSLFERDKCENESESSLLSKTLMNECKRSVSDRCTTENNEKNPC